MNRANLKFINLSTTTSRVSVRNMNESEREGEKPDSSVNYSGAASRIPEGEQFGVGVPGAPDSPVR